MANLLVLFNTKERFGCCIVLLLPVAHVVSPSPVSPTNGVAGRLGSYHNIITMLSIDKWREGMVEPITDDHANNNENDDKTQCHITVRLVQYHYCTSTLQTDPA